MTRRRRKSATDEAAEGLFDILRVVPAWVGPLIAVAVYLALRYAVPAWFGTIEGPPGEALGGVAKSLAPLGALVVLIIWAVAEFVKFRDRRLLDTRTGPGSLRDISWQEFERLVGEAYRRRGYTVRETPAGADGGVDLILERDGRTTLVQCKQWKSWKVGVRTIRELYGEMKKRGAVKAIVVCCGRFTPDAREFAKGEPLELIDGPALWRMIEGVRQGEAAMGSGAARSRSAPTKGSATRGTPRSAAADADQKPRSDAPVDSTAPRGPSLVASQSPGNAPTHATPPPIDDSRTNVPLPQIRAGGDDAIIHDQYNLALPPPMARQTLIPLPTCECWTRRF